MGFLDRLRGRAQETRRSLSKEDDLQRAALIAIGAMNASGGASNEEMQSATALIASRFGGAFQPSRVERELANAESVYKGGKFTFKAQLSKACEQVESPEEAESLFTIAADICAASSEAGVDIDPGEKAFLQDLGKKLRVNLANYDLA